MVPRIKPAAAALVSIAFFAPSALAQEAGILPPLHQFSQQQRQPSIPPVAKSVRLEARLTTNSAPMQYGLTWRIFKSIPGADGKLPMLAAAEGGSSSFELAPGDYFVNVAFGRAGTTKRLKISPTDTPETQILVLDAGGLILNAVSGPDMRIPVNELSFSIYSSDIREDGERGLVMENVRPNEIVRLNTGTYHVVSDYGEVNAVIRADIQVQAAKLTLATIQHKAAKISLKLVSGKGGEAIADTAWSILTGSGDIVHESVGAFPAMVLAEGKYTAIARNKTKLYQRDFVVQAGVNAEVEVLLTQ